MPRSARASAGGYCDHVPNRGNARAKVFHKPDDFAAFTRILAEAGFLAAALRSVIEKLTDAGQTARFAQRIRILNLLNAFPPVATAA